MGLAGAFGALGTAAKIGGGIAGASRQASGLEAIAESRTRLADYNHETAYRNARLSALLQTAGIEAREEGQEAQAELLRQQAGLDFWESRLQAKAHRKNAQRIRKYGRIEKTLMREEVRRKTADFERFKSNQRATYGASGVVIEQGSPIMVMAETAANMQLAINDMNYQIRLREAERREAASFEGFAAKMVRIRGNAQRAIDLAAADLVVEPTELPLAAVALGEEQAQRQADIARFVAYNDAQGLQAQAGATRAAGIGSAVGQGLSAASKLF